MMKPNERKERQENPGKAKHDAVVAAAIIAADAYRLDKKGEPYKVAMAKVEAAVAAQTDEEKIRTARYIQSRVIEGEMSMSALYAVKRQWVKATTVFREAYGLIPDRKRTKTDIRPNVHPVNGRKMLSVLFSLMEEKPEVHKAYTSLRSLLKDLNWLESAEDEGGKPRPKTGGMATVTGTPLEELPEVTKGELAILRRFEIATLEDLAATDPKTLGSFPGIGIQRADDMVTMAKSLLE